MGVAPPPPPPPTPPQVIGPLFSAFSQSSTSKTRPTPPRPPAFKRAPPPPPPPPSKTSPWIGSPDLPPQGPVGCAGTPSSGWLLLQGSWTQSRRSPKGWRRVRCGPCGVVMDATACLRALPSPAQGPCTASTQCHCAGNARGPHRQPFGSMPCGSMPRVDQPWGTDRQSQNGAHRALCERCSCAVRAPCEKSAVFHPRWPRVPGS